MIKSPLSHVALIFLLVFTNCTSVLKVHTEYDRKVDFTKFKTFSFYGFTDKTSGLTEFNRLKIISSIKSEMISHGFIQDEMSPDILVNATAILKEKSKVSNTNYYGYGGVYRPYYWGTGNNTGDVKMTKFNEGSLIIDIINASTKVLVWEGIGNKEIDVPIGKSETVIPDAVKKILSFFPPDVKK